MKHSKFLACCGLLLSTGMLLAGCGDNNPDDKKVNTFDVTFKDGETVLKTVEVESGKKVERWEPTKEGYTFDDWYATPSFSHKFDFNKAITADTSVFAAFQGAFQEDTREYAVVGKGISPVLVESNGGTVITERQKMTKEAGKNEYKFTFDLYKDDYFQFAINTSWHNQRGFGYLTETKDASGEEVFKTDGGAYQQSTKRRNIVCVKPGNYTFTLTTHPADDTVEVGTGSTDPNVMNINPFDTITWVRNGDAPELEAVTTYYIKGEKITKWANVYSPYHKMVENKDTHEHVLKVFLRKDDQFMFVSTNTIGTTVTDGSKQIKSDAIIDETSKTFVTVPETAGNIKAKADGEYTFTYKEGETPTLKVEFDASKTLPKADYYLDGTFSEGKTDWKDYCFKDEFKLVQKSKGSDVYEIKNVTLKKDSQIIIQAFKEGSTEKGDWGTESYNGLGSYNFTYLMGPGENFVPVGGGNNNIKVVNAGTYNIQFDIYSHTIVIADGYDIFIKGTMNGWQPQFKNDYKFTVDPENKALYTLTLEFTNKVVDTSGKESDTPWEFGFDKFVKGTKTAGEFIGKTGLGTDGDAHDNFDVTGHNIKCTVPGTYKIVLNVDTNVFNIYNVAK